MYFPHATVTRKVLTSIALIVTSIASSAGSKKRRVSCAHTESERQKERERERVRESERERDLRLCAHSALHHLNCVPSLLLRFPRHAWLVGGDCRLFRCRDLHTHSTVRHSVTERDTERGSEGGKEGRGRETQERHTERHRERDTERGKGERP